MVRVTQCRSRSRVAASGCSGKVKINEIVTFQANRHLLKGIARSPLPHFSLLNALIVLFLTSLESTTHHKRKSRQTNSVAAIAPFCS